MLWSILLELVVDCKDACRWRVLGSKAVASANDLDVVETCVCECCDDIKIEWLALCARFLGPVEDCNLLGCLWKGGDESVGCKRSVESDLDETNLLAVCVEVVDDLLCNVADGSHCNDYAVCIWSAVVVEELVVRSKLGVDLAHVVLYDFWKLVVVLVAGFSVLEEDVSVLVASPHVWVLWVECVCSECLDCIHVAHVLEVLIVPYCDLLDFVACAETVEEVDERNLSCECCKVCNRCKVHDFLDVAFTEHCETCLAACHDVAVVAKDVQGMCGDCTCAYVEHAWKLLRSDLVHVWNHKKKSLGCGVCGCEGT